MPSTQAAAAAPHFPAADHDPHAGEARASWRGTQQQADILPADIHRWRDDCANVSEGSPGAANRCLEILRAALNKAEGDVGALFRSFFGEFDFDGIDVALPTRTFDGRLDLEVGGREQAAHDCLEAMLELFEIDFTQG